MTRLVCVILLLCCINSYAQQADFSYKSGTTFCSPATVDFTQQCTGQPMGFIWDFGGEKSYEEAPSFTFKSAGTYTVNLTAIYDKSIAKVSKTITVHEGVTASLTASKNQLCQHGLVSFSALATGNGLNYKWDFGDHSAPITAATPNIDHHFSDFGTYTVTMTAISPQGCSKTANTVVKIAPPQITGSASPREGCVPATVRLRATVKLPAGNSVKSYTWDFDDGTAPVITTTGSVTRKYTKAGDYFPKVTVLTAEGCSEEYQFGEHSFGTPPVNLVAYPLKPSFCGSETVGFYAEATNANAYKWIFGDGSTAVDTLNLVNYRYRSLGTQSVKVIPSFNGCEAPAAGFQVQVVGVIASFRYTNTCSDRKTYDFKNTSLGNISSVAWNFGNGNTGETTYNASQTYPQSGTFKTDLLITDSISGCSDKAHANIYTANPILVNPEAAVCKRQFTTFTIEQNYQKSRIAYTWNVLGKSITGDSARLTTKPDSLGTFTNAVIINYGAESCPDTINLAPDILVRGPLPVFTVSSALCVKSQFTIANNSRGFIPTDSIIISSWNFGDNSGRDSLFQPRPYGYKKTGKYQIIYTATDINGCTDSLIQPVVVNRVPFVNMIPSRDTVCLGQSKTYVAFHSDSLSWTPSSLLSCASCDTVIARPDSTITIKVTTSNQYNCFAEDSVQIKVFQPFDAVSPVDGYAVCEKESVQLAIAPAHLKVSWVPAAGLSSASVYNPVASPSGSTSYQATLTDSAGCFSSQVNVDVLVNPLPRVDAGASADYPYMAKFLFTPSYSGNIRSYRWSPETHLDCATCPVPAGIAAETLTYYVSVLSDSGCAAKDSLTIGIKCSEDNLLMPGAFTPNNDNLNDYFYPMTRGVKKVIRFAIYNRFGQLIHEARDFAPNNRQFGWNGKFRGLEQPSSTYLYTLDVICDLGGSLHRQGSFLLLR